MCLSFSGLYAQDANQGAGQTAGTTSNKISPITLIQALANSDNQNERILAIQRIDRLVSAGNLDAATQSACTSILEALALQIKGRKYVNLANVRWEAAQTLGKITGPESYSILIRIIQNDDNSLVVSQAILSLATLKNDIDGAVLDESSMALKRFIARQIYDNTLAYAFLYACKEIGLKSGNSAGADMLLNLMDNTHFKREIRMGAASFFG